MGEVGGQITGRLRRRAEGDAASTELLNFMNEGMGGGFGNTIEHRFKQVSTGFLEGIGNLVGAGIEAFGGPEHTYMILIPQLS